MSDIVERLRSLQIDHKYTLREEAAAEIDRLRARNAELEAALAEIMENGNEHTRQIARAALAKAEHDPRDDFSPQNDPFAKAT